MGFGDGYNSPKFSGQTAIDIETGARLKRVLSPDMVAHVWAQGRQTIGETAKGNFYFSGETLYSYGRHYVAGYLLPNGFALINATRDSPTTNGHVSSAGHATRPRRAYAPDLTELRRHLENLTRGTFRDRNRVMIPANETFGESPESPECLARQVADARAKVESYVCQHAADYPDACLQLIPFFSAARSPEKHLEKMKAKRARDVARTAEAARKAATRDALAMGRRLLKFPVADVPAHKKPGYLDNLDRLDSAIGIKPRACFQYGEYMPGKGARVIADAAKLMREAGQEKAAKHAGKIARALYAAQRAQDAYKARNRRRDRLYMAITNRREYVRRVNAAQWSDDRAQALFNLFNCLDTLAYESAIGQKGRDALLTQRAAAREAYKEAAAQVKAEADAKRAAQKAEWLAGVPGVSWRGDTPTGGVYIRAVNVTRDESGAITGGALETSRGAEVPLPHAVKAFRFVKRCREAGKAWRANGHTIRVGHFRIDSIESSGDFIAGCHLIEWAQIEALAKSLGVFELAPDDSALESTGRAH